MHFLDNSNPLYSACRCETYPTILHLSELMMCLDRSCFVLRLLHVLTAVDVMSCILHDLALILGELPCSDLSLEDLVQLLKTATLSLRYKQIEPYDAYEIGSRPDVCVLRTLSQR